MTNRPSLPLLLLSLLALLVLTACGVGGGAEPEPTPQPVSVERGEIVTTVSSTGRLQPLRTTRLSLVGGTVTEVKVALGERVAADQPLLELERDTLDRAVQTATQALRLQEATLIQLEETPTQAERDAAQSALSSAQIALDDLEGNFTEEQANNSSEVLAARAQVAQAQAAVDRLEPSNAQLEVARAQLEQARVSLATAQASLEAATLRAPFDGTVTAILVSEGEQATGPVIEIVDDSAFEAVLSVDEVDMAELAVGQAATLTVEAWPTQPLSAEVARIAPAATTIPNSPLVSYEVILQLSDTELPLRSGMTVSAEIVTAEQADALLVPNSALRIDRAMGKSYVTLLQDGEPEEVEVETGLRNSTRTEILSGVEEGAQLLPSDYTPAEEVDSGGLFGGPPGDDD